ncbi:histidine kinase [Flammeovirgaceae bacterium SG7u.111]|nr:histidine kinase [Flammeovirgaceae bacterium SG7u.132]WPO35731.1 histidine kinase [Flammeovirgaceae bacterium SG7u.111]
MRFLLCLLLLVISGISFSQNMEMASFHISQQDGLPSNTVYDIFQDSQGFLWVATENGLARYNGAEFRWFSNPQVRSQAVGYLSEDNKGRIWLHNYFGELLFVENDSLKKLHSWEKYYQSGFPRITNIGDKLLLSSPSNIFFYEIEKEKWSRLDSLFEHSQFEGGGKINYADHLVYEDELWSVFSKRNTAIVKSLFNPSKQYTIQYKKCGLNQNTLQLTTFNSKIWLYDSSCHLLFELYNGKVKDISEKYDELLKDTRQIKNLGNGMVAFFGPSGCYLLDEKSDRWFLLNNSRNVSSIASDSEGGIWLGTLNEGIFYYPSLETTIIKKSQNDILTKLAVDNKHKKVVAGAYDGSLLFYSFEGELTEKIAPQSSREIQSLFVDERNDKLLYYGKELKIMNLDNLSLVKSMVMTALKDIVQLDKGYGLATSAGLSIVVMDSVYSKKNSSGIKQRCASVGYDSINQRIWLGTQKGLKKVSLETNEVSLWQPTGLGFSPGVSEIDRYKDQFFIGTYTDGLMIIEGEEMKRHITMSEGLPSDHITALASTDTQLFIGTDRGIAIYTFKDESIYLIDDTKGLTANEIYDLVVAEANLWVSTPNGLQIFNSFSVKNTQKPKIHITNISSGDKVFAGLDKNITLSPDLPELRIDFDVSNSLRSRGKAMIHYRIKELNGGNWSITSLKYPSAKYQSLQAGKYTFEVMAINEDGVQSANVIRIPFNVLAPIWKRPQFLILVFLFILLCSVVFVYIRLERINEANKQQLLRKSHEQDLRIAQLTSIRSQMNPHFIFNTMSLIQGKVLNGLNDQANKAIQDFSLLMRKVLDFSSKEMVALADEIEVIEKYLSIEKNRFDDKLTYDIILDEKLKDELIKLPSLLTQPFVENALRHGLLHKEGKKELLISFSLVEEILVIVIDDNGIGRAAALQVNKSRRNNHHSFALEAYSKRIELLNMDRKNKIELDIIDKLSMRGLPVGTKVVIKLPLINEPVNIS